MQNDSSSYPAGVHGSGSADEPGATASGFADTVTRTFFSHSTAPRTNTDAVISKAIRAQYPSLELVVTTQISCDLRGFADSGHAKYWRADTTPPTDGWDGKVPSALMWKVYTPPPTRLDGATGMLREVALFCKLVYQWEGTTFVVYLIDGRDGQQSYPQVLNAYVLGPTTASCEALILAASRWTAELHGEVWVFDGGYWSKSAELFRSIAKASWDEVILDEGMKKAIIEDHLSFFSSRDTYADLKVPWKRGLIYYGPPGNGKTISIKAMMHTLYARKPEVPTLYVRSLSSFAGPEYSLREIFAKARSSAPCYLVFEDLDSIVSDRVRSYFLNEVDGLRNNDGIFMVGSTNHLDQLDPGISKRPSRFDRKYYFPEPDLEQRIAYCKFWQKKLASNKDIDFPNKLCKAIADITAEFSFAYLQEAFVAALLTIARGMTVSDRDNIMADRGDGWVEVAKVAGGGGDDDGDLEKLVLWVEIKKQIKILREGMEEKQARPGGHRDLWKARIAAQHRAS